MKRRMAISLFFLLQTLPLTGICQESPATPAVEIQLQVVNSLAGVSRTFTATSTHGIIWDLNGDLVPNPSEYNNKSVLIVGNWIGYDKGFDYNGDWPEKPQLRKSQYRISVSDDTVSSIIDWQGCFFGPGDVVVRYDAASHSFTLQNAPGPWDQSCLQPTNPSNLQVTASGGHPYLTWSASTPSVAKYNVYQSTLKFGTYYNLNGSPISPTNWTDDTNMLGEEVRVLADEEKVAGSYCA